MAEGSVLVLAVSVADRITEEPHTAKGFPKDTGVVIIPNRKCGNLVALNNGNGLIVQGFRRMRTHRYSPRMTFKFTLPPVRGCALYLC